MFSRHVTKDISAYCHGELSSEAAKHFAEHIIACGKCRSKFEEVKLGVKLAEQLPQISAPDHLWRDIEALLGIDTSPVRTSSPLWSWRVQVPAAAVLILVLSLVASWIYGPAWIPPQRIPRMTPINAAWQVKRLAGTPRIGTEEVANNGNLDVGEWLETDGGSRAQIAVGSIGNVEIDPNTRVRLVANQPNDHRLELARGRMSARIWAPPRLFFVDTPSAVAADMGCAYTLEVDDQGTSKLVVTSGWVALQTKDRESMVPAGAACETRRNLGPGTPYFIDASPAFRDALRTLDINDDPPSRSAALFSLLDQARTRDTLTLWHLLPRVNKEERLHVFGRLSVLAPPPVGVTRDGILDLDPTMLETWKQALEPSWTGMSDKKTWSKAITDAYGRLKYGVSRRLKDMAPK